MAFDLQSQVSYGHDPYISKRSRSKVTRFKVRVETNGRTDRADCIAYRSNMVCKYQQKLFLAPMWFALWLMLHFNHITTTTTSLRPFVRDYLRITILDFTEAVVSPRPYASDLHFTPEITMPASLTVFLRARCSPCHPTNIVKSLKAFNRI